MTLKLFFIVLSIVAFILAAVFAFGVGNVSTDDVLGIIACGLALYAAASIVPATVVTRQ